MPIMAKSNDEYAEVKAIKTPDGTEIDYVLSKVDNTYKRTYTATRELEDAPPLNFKSIKPNANLIDYRIYGQTVDGESVGDLVTSGEHAGEYKVPVTVEGKNLWSGVVEQGAVSIIGDYEDSSKRIRSKNIPLEPGTYKLTSNLLVRMIFAYHDSTKFGKMFDVADGSENPSFTVPEGANNISVAMMKLVDGAEVDITPEDFEYGQIEKGSETTPYEPYHAPVTTPIYLPEQIKKVGDEAEYIDYGEQKMHRVRKNLLQNTATSQTINGVTFTVNSDGSVTCNGTASETVFYKIGVVPFGNCILNGCPQNGSANSYLLRIIEVNPPVVCCTDFGGGATANITNTSRCEIRIDSNYTCDNLTFYPMIRKADITDDTYEPYIENTDLDVTLPALPTVTGTNVLSVGTEVQPSDMYIKGNFKMIAGGGE